MTPILAPPVSAQTGAPCDGLPGVSFVGTECRVTGVQTLSGTYNIPHTLHLTAASALRAITTTDPTAPTVVNLNITGDLILDAGATISGDTGSPNPTGRGATLNITVTG